MILSYLFAVNNNINIFNDIYIENNINIENYINKHNAELQRADPGTKVTG